MHPEKINIPVDPTWRKVDDKVFRDYLRYCHDARTERFDNGTYYYFGLSGNRFAFVDKNNDVRMDPDLFENK